MGCRRIRICLKELKQNHQKQNFTGNAAPENIEYESSGLITENNNICKTIIHILFFTIFSARVVLSGESVYFEFCKLTMWFPYLFYVQYTVLFSVYLHTVLYMCRSTFG